MSPLRYCTSIFVLFAGVSTFEVQQTLTLIQADPNTDSRQAVALHLLSPSLDKVGSGSSSGHAEQPLEAHPNGGGTIMQHFLSQHLATSTTSLAKSHSFSFFVTMAVCWLIMAIFFMG